MSKNFPYKIDNDATENAAILADLLAACGGQVKRMFDAGQLSERFQGMLVAQLNAPLYTLAFALPPNLVKITMIDTGEIRVTKKG